MEEGVGGEIKETVKIQRDGGSDKYEKILGKLKEGVPRTHFRAGWEGRTDLEGQDVEQNYEGRVQVPGGKPWRREK